MKGIVVKFFKSLIFLLLVLIIFTVSLYFIGSFFKEDLKKYALNEINKEINLKMHVDSVDVTIFEKFPFISVVLSDITGFPSPGFEKNQFSGIVTDTLFTASRIYLQFDLISIFKKDFNIRRIHAQDGKIILLTDKSGKVNYRIFRKDLNSRKDNNTSLSMGGLKISGFQCRLINLSKGINVSGFIDDIFLKGKFSRNKFSINSNGMILINSFSNEQMNYANNLKITIKTTIEVSDSIYQISKGEINLNDIIFQTKGSLVMSDPIILGLETDATNVDLNDFLDLLPVKYKFLEKSESSGKIDLTSKVSGQISKNITPDILISFKLHKGKFILPKTGKIDKLEMNGTYSNGKYRSASSSSLKIHEFNFVNKDSDLKGDSYIQNLIQPSINLKVNGNLQAKYFSELLAIEGLKIEKGKIYPDLIISTRLNDINDIKIKDFNKINITGKLILDSISGYFPDLEEPIEMLKGEIFIKEDIWNSDLSGKVGKTDLKVNIEIDSLLKYLTSKKHPLWLKGDVYSHYTDLKEIIKKDKPSPDSTGFRMPEKIKLQLNFKADSLMYGKFSAQNVSTSLKYFQRLFTFSSLHMKTMQGFTVSDGFLLQDTSGVIRFSSKNHLNKIDINEMFFTFNNFGQKFIVADNLKGLISGEMQVNISLNDFFKPDFSTLTANSDIIISEGELLNFEPIKELSGFIELSELEHIRFSTLQNSILINNNNVYIPKMDINSTAFNITLSGLHGFDNSFDYKIRVNLSEILAAKAFKAKKENEEFGIIEKGDEERTSIYLSVTGKPENYKIKYDKKEAVNNIRRDLQKERKVLKSILNEEFGLFKKDTSILKQKGGNQQNKFIIDLGNEEKVAPVEKKRSVKKENEPEFEIVWE